MEQTTWTGAEVGALAVSWLPRLCANPACRAPIEHLRRDAKTCSGACRQALFAQRTYGIAPTQRGPIERECYACKTTHLCEPYDYHYPRRRVAAEQLETFR